MPVTALLVVCGAIGVALVALDGREVGRLLGHADWRLVPLAVLATAISYGALGGGLVAIARLVGIEAPARVLVQIAFVSNAANHLLSSAGVVGYSLNTALVGRHHSARGDVLAMSVMQSYLNNLALLALMLGSVVYLLATDPELAGPVRGGMAVGAGIAAIFLALSTAALLGERLRGRLIKLTQALMRRLLPRRWRGAATDALNEVDSAFRRTTGRIRARPLLALVPLFWVILDWAAALCAFWFCVDAFGDALPLALLMGGFTIGVALGFVSLVPGGLGVQEGSQTAVLALLGVQVEHAALAAVLFRVVYYFLPFLMSLALYRSIVRAPLIEARRR